MASLIIQDVFDPYYAGRDERPADRVGLCPKPVESKLGERRLAKPGDIIRLKEVPAPVHIVRRERLPVAH